MAHASMVYDDNGETIDIIYYCSDACNRAHTGAAYQGWHGCIELEFGDWCAQCGTLLASIHPACACDSFGIVNRFPSMNGKQCKHGTWLQLPAGWLDSLAS